LLEKYKTLARDAQMQGDRVNTEYYLQFADHYFRVLSENRARFEEQRPAGNRQNENRDDFGDDDGGDGQRNYQGRDDQNGDDGWDDNDQAPQQAQPEPQRTYAPRQERQERPERAERPERQPYQGSGNGNGNADGNREPGVRESRDSAPREGAPRERGRRNGNSNAGNGNANGNSNVNANGFSAPDFLNEPISPRLDLDRAPEAEPVQAANPEAAQGDEGAPKRRRAPRRPRGETAPVEV